MTIPSELICLVESAGGRFEVMGDQMRVVPKESAAPLLAELRQHKEAILGLVRERELDRLRVAFVAWFDCRIHLDAREIALRQTPAWSTTVDALHADFERWMSARDQAPPTSAQFRLLLREPGCSLRTIRGDEFVDYVALKEDVQAHEQFARE